MRLSTFAVSFNLSSVIFCDISDFQTFRSHMTPFLKKLSCHILGLIYGKMMSNDTRVDFSTLKEKNLFCIQTAFINEYVLSSGCIRRWYSEMPFSLSRYHSSRIITENNFPDVDQKDCSISELKSIQNVWYHYYFKKWSVLFFWKNGTSLFEKNLMSYDTE